MARRIRCLAEILAGMAKDRDTPATIRSALTRAALTERLPPRNREHRRATVTFAERLIDGLAQDHVEGRERTIPS